MRDCTEFGACGATPNPKVGPKSGATAYREGVFKAAFRLTSVHSKLRGVLEVL
jgi:hypothetical protein